VLVSVIVLVDVSFYSDAWWLGQRMAGLATPGSIRGTRIDRPRTLSAVAEETQLEWTITALAGHWPAASGPGTAVQASPCPPGAASRRGGVAAVAADGAMCHQTLHLRCSGASLSPFSCRTRGTPCRRTPSVGVLLLPAMESQPALDRLGELNFSRA
jgi:hypothetical protein